MRGRDRRVEVEDEPVHPAIDGAHAESEGDGERAGTAPMSARSPSLPGPSAMSRTASGRTIRRPMRSVSRPPAIEPPTEATALTKKKTPMPASVCSNAGSIERISDGTSRPVQPTRASPAQPRAAGDRCPPGVGEGHGQMLAGRVAAPPGRWTGALSSEPWRDHRRLPHGASNPAGRTASGPERRAVLRPRRERDVRGAAREPSPGSRTRSGPVAGMSGRRAGVAAPSGLRLGNWRRRSTAGAPVADPARRACRRRGRAAILRLVTNYFEDRREALFDALGAQLLADVIGYHAAPRLDPCGPARGAGPRRGERRAGGRCCRSALSLGGIALVDLLAGWPEAPVEACVTVGSQAPLLYTFDAIPSMPYDEADPPHLPVPWLNIYDSRDFLSFLAEPLFRRSDGLASVVDLRVRSGKDFPKSHSAYWELGAGLGRDRDGVQLEAGRATDRARGAPARLRGTQGASSDRG